MVLRNSVHYEQQKQYKINAHNEELKRHKLEMEKQEEEKSFI
mgnify:CR=1 FL=1